MRQIQIKYLDVNPGNTTIVMMRENRYENGCNAYEFGPLTLKTLDLVNISSYAKLFKENH